MLKFISNWKTTVSGILTGSLLIIKGWESKDYSQIGVGFGAILTGLFAKDGDKE